jgi:hypothetical protein
MTRAASTNVEPEQRRGQDGKKRIRAGVASPTAAKPAAKAIPTSRAISMGASGPR